MSEKHYPITKATLSDVPEIMALNQQFYLNIPEFRWGTVPWIREEIEKSNYYVMRDAQGIAATLCLECNSTEHHKAGVIESIAIRPDLQHCGLGKKLVDFAKESCKGNPSLSRVVAESFCEYGDSVKNFYENNGFRRAPKTRIFQGHEYYYFWIPLERQQDMSKTVGASL